MILFMPLFSVSLLEYKTTAICYSIVYSIILSKSPCVLVCHNFRILGRLTVVLQFNSHKSVQNLFHNMHIIVSNSFMGFKVICQLETEPLKFFLW